MRSWFPWSLLVVLIALATAGAVVGATTNRSESPGHGVSTFHHSVSSSNASPPSTPTSFPPQAGYRGVETFCAVAPLTGNIYYDGTSGDLTGVLTVSVSGLPPNDEVNVNWSNDYVRAPVIAGFMTDSAGKSVPSSVRVSRLGEVKGVEIVLTAASVPNPVLGHLVPCGTSSMAMLSGRVSFVGSPPASLSGEEIVVSSGSRTVARQRLATDHSFRFALEPGSYTLTLAGPVSGTPPSNLVLVHARATTRKNLTMVLFGRPR